MIYDMIKYIFTELSTHRVAAVGRLYKNRKDTDIYKRGNNNKTIQNQYKKYKILHKTINKTVNKNTQNNTQNNTKHRILKI
jgi:hypothetical protein